MSYDVSIRDKNNEVLCDAGNYTCNVSKMYREALGFSLHDLDETKASEVVKVINKGILDMVARSKHYKGMNPSNGLGDYEGALKYLLKIKFSCDDYPEYYLRVT